MYWSEWDTHAIYQADKFTGANMTMVTSTDSVHLPMVVQVYPPFRQPDYPNLCLPFNGHCSHLCLPAPGHRSLACRCPPSYTLSEDNRTCTPSGEWWHSSDWIQRNRQQQLYQSCPLITGNLNTFNLQFVKVGLYLTSTSNAKGCWNT